MTPTLYIETTIPSYLVARASRDPLVLGHQQVTQKWWAQRRAAFDLCISQAVLDEAKRGDTALAMARLALISNLRILPETEEVRDLSDLYYAELRLPARARVDATHLAFAAAHRVDYLMTWNCAHINGAQVRRRLERLNDAIGLPVPTICTPEELEEEMP